MAEINELRFDGTCWNGRVNRLTSGRRLYAVIISPFPRLRKPSTAEVVPPKGNVKGGAEGHDSGDGTEAVPP